LISLSGVKASLIGGFFLLLCILLVIFVSPNANVNRGIYDLEIADSMTAAQVCQQLETDNIIGNYLSFNLATLVLGYRDSIPHGLFQIRNGWSNWAIINHLKSTPPASTTVVIKPFQRRRNTLQHLCKTLDIKHNALKSWLEDEAYIQQWGRFNKDNVYCILIPDTILVYQDSRAKEVADRLFRNYQAFWTPERLEKAAMMGLTKQETGILASIVYAETKKVAEMPVIAGLYMNRLKKEMRLQADPTIVFAYGRPLTRVLKAHKKINSPYNTYDISGLPPGPVFTAPDVAVQAVLHPQSHDFLYFCARRDFSGGHHFSRTLEEHLTVARKYQKELNRRRIGYSGS
jgi:UPF0755 protein